MNQHWRACVVAVIATMATLAGSAAAFEVVDESTVPPALELQFAHPRLAIPVQAWPPYPTVALIRKTRSSGAGQAAWMTFYGPAPGVEIVNDSVVMRPRQLSSSAVLVKDALGPRLISVDVVDASAAIGTPGIPDDRLVIYRDDPRLIDFEPAAGADGYLYLSHGFMSMSASPSIPAAWLGGYDSIRFTINYCSSDCDWCFRRSIFWIRSYKILSGDYLLLGPSKSAELCRLSRFYATPTPTLTPSPSPTPTPVPTGTYVPPSVTPFPTETPDPTWCYPPPTDACGPPSPTPRFCERTMAPAMGAVFTESELPVRLSWGATTSCDLPNRYYVWVEAEGEEQLLAITYESTLLIQPTNVIREPLTVHWSITADVISSSVSRHSEPWVSGTFTIVPDATETPTPMPKPEGVILF